MPMMYGGYGMGWFGGIFMMLIPLALLGLVVYWAVNSGVKNALKEGSSSGALDILKSRYARNEITEDEYKKLKEELSR
ncbi:MAG: SHOCT domain-containing protein [Firmicutes bacterium]|nr:SHOCT domain-containing protein [Desulforamulus reducens]MCL5781621.1 SHOCT domain-containing protein [Bacillota bacterium]